jgi:CO dehydrogenase nickel-insertion accessory protein CooC1
MRLREGHADVVLVVAQPTAKSLTIARRAVDMTDDRGGRVIVVANRVRDDEDLAVIREAVGECEMVVVPDDEAIATADREGRAAIDVDENSPGVKVLIDLANRLASMAVPA